MNRRDEALTGIKTGKDQARVTLKDVADDVGVSISTVSRALAGASGISKDVRSRIQSAADRLNYAGTVPGLGPITVLTDLHLSENAASEYMLAVQRGIEQRVRELGLTLSLSMVNSTGFSRMDTDAETSGYLLLSVQQEELIELLTAQNMPAVIVNGRDPLMRLDAVAPANRTGGYLGARHLLDLGHKRILTLIHTPRPTIRDRVAGKGRAMREAGVTEDPDLTVELAALRSDLTYQAITERLNNRSGLDFTAIWCANDACAFGAIAALNSMGFSVPGDVSVVGFDDIPTAALNSVPLTTIRVEAEDIGARSVNRLIERIKAQDSLATYTETAVRLVARNSTGQIS